ncbi:HAD-IIIC family phosphatase [Streptomyces yaizuensis]|uniref:HAD-IIIC family phosphatase n=1 Tax=Streptomyces yaizuensis TaxID=2989713 RepID=A0ABQ5NS68_9ACTN|nr:HAD-IIIC family phosphatase [Streptomyces sp. YSPA8]GLF93212.1 HAD-IIIC family phosphatase [Streptomyces sp. YSPA8]
MTRDLVAVAATFTADPLPPLLRDALEHIEAPHRVESAPYGQLVEQLLSPSGHFARNTTGINAGLVRTADWAGSPERVDAFVAAAREFAAAHGTPTVFVLCPDPPEPGVEHPGREPAPARLLAGLRDVPGLALVDAADWFTAYGCHDVHDTEAADIAHIPYTDEAFAVLAVGIARVVHSTLARPRKVIVADCDETLWGGACGDRAPADLDLGGHFAQVRRFLRHKHDEGFVLALASRNDPDSVERVFTERARDLLLTREHFVAARVDWKPKSQSILSLADELRLGVDAFVLVDDDPYVCAEVAEALPEVAVVHVGPGTDPPAVLRHCWELDRFFSTAEDRTRNDGYRADALRREAGAGATDTALLNERLGTVVAVDRAGPADLPRIGQLLARTNQFTSATAGAADLPALLRRPAATAWTARLRDRFGDYGTIAAAVATPGDDGTTHVDCFAMSCRALDRGVAEALFTAVAEDGPSPSLRVRFRRTGRNGPALEFLRRHGSADPAPTGRDEDPLTDLVFAVPVSRLAPTPVEGARP